MRKLFLIILLLLFAVTASAIHILVNGQPIEVRDGDRVISTYNHDSLYLNTQVWRRNPLHPEYYDILVFEKQEWFRDE